MRSSPPRGPSPLIVAVLLAVAWGGWGSEGRTEAGEEKQPTPRLNAYFASDFTDAAYQQAALNKVLKGWKVTAPLPPPGKKTVVISTIGRDGAVLETRYNLKSDDAAFDAAALQAVKSASPFQPFPNSYPRPTVEVHWHFEVR